ncbi:MAG TPA: hypothetical protein VK666_08725 [Chryseolinea sp.]|nr:hypothetical protein [Chryseolinea sp.]
MENRGENANGIARRVRKQRRWESENRKVNTKFYTTTTTTDMKKLMTAAMFTLSGFASMGQSIAIPIPVLNAFATRYPGINEVAWDYNEPDYQVSFKFQNKAMLLTFDETGVVNEVKNEIMMFELPVDVNNLIAREYPGWRVGKAMHIDMKGTAYYETVVEKEKTLVTLVFDRTGELMIKMIQ